MKFITVAPDRTPIFLQRAKDLHLEIHSRYKCLKKPVHLHHIEAMKDMDSISKSPESLANVVDILQYDLAHITVLTLAERQIARLAAKDDGQAKAREVGEDDRCFTLFNDLPKDLRLKIWSHAAEEDRVAKIHKLHPTERAGNDTTEGKDRIISNQPFNPIVHTCYESRSTYLFSTGKVFAFGTFINFNIDTIYLPSPVHENIPGGWTLLKLVARESATLRLVQKFAVMVDLVLVLDIEVPLLRTAVPNCTELLIFTNTEKKALREYHKYCPKPFFVPELQVMRYSARELRAQKPLQKVEAFYRGRKRREAQFGLRPINYKLGYWEACTVYDFFANLKFDDI